ncbi:P-loop containing nucleoside triphosphate hydrolase protein, partial [Neoconidiobolus thromboides FSU 785]
RVFLKDSPVIILDEATSSLDNITENLLQKALKNLSREKKTMVIIAHRLTTIKHADCIICLKDGKIHEQGTHDDLLKLKGEYYKLWSNHKK